MLFNSIEFLIFLIIIYCLYRILPFYPQNVLLLIASYIFYGWWDVHFLFLIVLSTVIDFYCGAMIDVGRLARSKRLITSLAVILAALCFDTLRWNAIQIQLPFTVSVQWGELLPTSWSGWLVLLTALIAVAIINLLYPQFQALEKNCRRRVFLWTSICANLLLLGFFKYFNFFINSLEAAIHALGIQTELLNLNIILPVGISFYTFKAISYACDIYSGKLKASNNFLNFALFWAYFPPLFAGPIDRAAELLPQLSNPRQISFQQSAQGLFLILFGLVKKVAIADGLARSVEAIYGSTGTVSWLDIVIATFLYAIQIYCDFCGYSDIARGVSKLFGIELMINFNLPYFSKSPGEFWHRWHISLSTWLRDYLYIPLGGSRQGELKTYSNLMITMLLGGLWHGAAWNFVLWGFYQGMLLCIYRAFSTRTSKLFSPIIGTYHFKLLGGLVATMFCFTITCYGWLLFRATSLEQIATFTNILLADFGNFSLTVPKPPLPTLIGIPLLISYEFLEYFTKTHDFRFHFPPPLRAALYSVLILILLMGESNAPAQFIYSQF